MTALVTVRIGADPAAWAALGFDTTDGRVVLANGALELGAAAPGLSSLGVSGIDDIDGELQVDGVGAHAAVADIRATPISHPNGARSIDHVVIMTDSLDRTSAAIEATLGLERRRLRETDTVRQAFHRFADPEPTTESTVKGGERGCILELVENPRLSRPEYWGLVVIVDDLDALHAGHPDLVAPPKIAVQPGRRIATARRDADLGTAVAFMTP